MNVKILVKRETESIQEQLIKAKDMLTNSKFTIIEICHRCTPGLTVSQFIKTFRLLFGYTPAMFRKSLK